MARTEKVAEVAAEELRRRILDQRLVAGTRLGSQAEFIEEMGVSRGSAREAMRLLENQGLVRVKPGPNGGIYVAPPNSENAIKAAANYLEFTGTDVSSLFHARLAVEVPLTRLAAERASATPAVHERMQDVLDSEMQIVMNLEGDGEPRAIAVSNRASFDFHLEVAHASGNAPLSLCCEILVNLGEFEGSRLEYDYTALNANHRAHLKIVEAIVAGQADLAARRMGKHLEATLAWVSRVPAPSVDSAPV